MLDNIDNNLNALIQQLDRETMGHCIGMQHMAIDFENYLGINDQTLSTSALLCDLGKLYLSPYILTKQDMLTNFEIDLLYMHPYFSYKIINQYYVEPKVQNLVLYHHQKSRNISINDNLPPYESSLENLYTTLELIDAYQSLVEYRTYRSSMYSPSDAYEILKKEGSFNEDGLDYIKKNYLF